jgi:hypothetical protein
MSIRPDQLSYVRFSSSFALGVLILVTVVSSAGAQTQASCQFTTFTTRFFISSSSGYRFLVPRGVNDYGTVVGEAQDDGDFSVRAFTRSSGGGISYYRHNSMDTFFTDRTNAGVTIGVVGGQFALGSMNGTPFKLQGSTFTPSTFKLGGKTYSKFTVWGTNRWGTIVGTYADSSGYAHGFKRYSDGSAVALDYPGSAETVASAINDNGTVVGSYTRYLSPNAWWHGFIYNNGKWATLSYPSSTLETMLSGISNANLIVGTTVTGRSSVTVQGSFLYQNGTFKKIVMPNSSVPTYAHGVSPGKGLITGFSGYTGFVAMCK